jgi:uncharacterized protein HemX
MSSVYHIHKLKCYTSRMGLYVRKEEQRSKLQEKIAAELREKAKRNESMEMPTVDGVDDSNYMEGTKNSSSLLGVWLVLLVLGVVAVIYLIVRSA